jgi:hypothetical protein
VKRENSDALLLIVVLAAPAVSARVELSADEGGVANLELGNSGTNGRDVTWRKRWVSSTQRK